MPLSKLLSGALLRGSGQLAKLTAGIRANSDLHRTSASLIRGPNQGPKLNAAAWSNTWPAPGATLDLDFANNRGFVRGVGQGGAMGAVTFTRATVGNYVDNTGTVQSAANNIPRFDWASTASTGAGTAVNPYVIPLQANSTCNGLLIEESRTNRLLWCRDATQSDWTKTNVTAAKTATGIDGVANAASILTATADGGTCIQTVTLASGSRTSSVYLKRITGTGNVQVSFDGSTWSTVDLSNGLYTRIVLSGTVTNPVVGIRLATNGDAVAMDYGQIEDSNNATPVTSPILTTSATATRAADVCTMVGQNFYPWFDGYTGMLYTEFLTPLLGSNTSYGPLGAMAANPSSAVNSSSVFIYNSTASYVGAVSYYSGTANLGSYPNISPRLFYKTAISYTLAGQTMTACATNAAPVIVTLKGNYNQSFPLTTFYIGHGNNSSNYLNSCVRRVVFVPKFFNQTAVQTITRPTT